MTDWIQIGLAGILVFITWRYVEFTKRIMSAAVDQARAANIATLISVQQWKFQQVQKLLPIKLAITGAIGRIAELDRRVGRHDDTLVEIELYSEDLDTARVLAATTSTAIATNLHEAVVLLRKADSYLETLADDSGPWETPEVERVVHLSRTAVDKLRVAQSWLDPLLEPVEGVAYPTDEALSELAEKLGA
jgi:hypothetical protein